MNLEIGTEAAQFPEKEYINGSFLAMPISFYGQCGSIPLRSLIFSSFCVADIAWLSPDDTRRGGGVRSQIRRPQNCEPLTIIPFTLLDKYMLP